MRVLGDLGGLDDLIGLSKLGDQDGRGGLVCLVCLVGLGVLGDQDGQGGLVCLIGLVGLGVLGGLGGLGVHGDIISFGWSE